MDVQLLVHESVTVMGLEKLQHPDQVHLTWFVGAVQKVPEQLTEKLSGGMKVQAQLCICQVLHWCQTVVEAVVL